jgi:hypothetical protein
MSFSGFVVWLVASCFAPAFAGLAAPAKESKYEVLLIWATNAEKSPDPHHTPVDADTLKKLRELPLKWKNYFVVNRASLEIPKGESKEVTLSNQCKIAVKDVDGKSIEVSLIGEGQPVLKRTQPLPRGKILVLGGDAPDETGWLVVLKRIE